MTADVLVKVRCNSGAAMRRGLSVGERIMERAFCAAPADAAAIGMPVESGAGSTLRVNILGRFQSPLCQSQSGSLEVLPQRIGQPDVVGFGMSILSFTRRRHGIAAQLRDGRQRLGR